MRKSGHLKNSEGGNVFFTLFGAVAVVGLLGAAIMNTMRGPLSTIVQIQYRTQAEAEMAIAAKLVLLEATEAYTDGDCDSDNFVEPLEFVVGTGPVGGGQLPVEVGSNKQDPWGVEYGYCAWDAGGTIDDAGCGGGTQNRLDGNEDGSDESYTVIAVVSAGPDKTFQTTCAGGATPGVTKTAGSDDIWNLYNYTEATVASGGLWRLKSGDVDTAEITKDLEVTGGAKFTDALDLTTSASAQLRLGAASMLLPTQAELPLCDAANDLLLRVNTTFDPPLVEICDKDAGPAAWVSVAAGADLWQQNGDEIYYDTDNVGIGLADPTEALDVDGNIKLTGDVDVGGDVQLADTNSVIWAGGEAIAGNGGDLEINAAGANGTEIDVSNDAVDINADVTVTGSTADGTANALTVNDSAAAGLFVVENDGDVGIGVADPGSALDVAGDIDASGRYKIDGATVLNSDSAMSDTILVGKNAGALVTGDTNTIVGGSAAATLTTGTGNIVIGNAVDVPAVGTAGYLNIGDAIHGDLVTKRIGIGFADTFDVSAFDATLEVNGATDITGNVDIGGTLGVGDTLTVAATDFNATGCGDGEILKYDSGDGWDCSSDAGGGSGGGGQNLEEVLGVGDDAAGQNAEDFGKVGADEYCAADLTSCTDSGDLRDAAEIRGENIVSTLSTDTTADGQLMVWSQTNTQWEIGDLGDLGVNDLALDATIDATTCTSGEVAVSNGAGDWVCGDAGDLSGSGVTADSLDYDDFVDAMALDASTSITADGTEVLSVVNTGTGNSFLVEDEAADSTPFVINAYGNVGIGTISPTSKLHVSNVTGTTGVNTVVAAFNVTSTNNGGSGILRVGTANLGHNTDIEQNDGGTGSFRYGTYADTNIVNDTQSNGEYGNINFVTGSNIGASSVVMTIGGGSQKGKVGIGDQTPDAKLDVEGGNVRFSDYGSGSVSGTAAYLLAVEADGDVIEMGLSSVDTISDDSLDYSDFIDAMNLDASTSITADGTEVLSVVNTGTGNSLLVEDEAADASPFVINTAGLVGIGDATPDAKLDVEGGSMRLSDYGSGTVSGTAAYLLAVEADGDVMELGLTSVDTVADDSLDYADFEDAMDLDASTSITADNAEVLSIVNTGTGNTLLVGDEAADASPFVIDAAGQVGIGTTAPGYKLDVNGNFRAKGIWTSAGDVTYWGYAATPTAYGVMTWDTGYASVYATAGNILKLGANGGQGHLVINTSGNVGIGDATPDAKLDVEGVQ